MPRKSRPRLDKDELDFRRRLLRWFRAHGRDLPWRRTRDPYHIAVSEFMLQQTQVSRVEGFYLRFLERFPSVHHLAAAPAAAVREAWEGLGYYRRAHNLQRLAQHVAARDDGFPREPEALRELPGVGPYTAGAIACFAFERAAPAVDTNVERVIRRAFHPRLGRSAADARRVWATAERLVPRAGTPAWSFNQAIMELGALVCTARVAKCGDCPVRGACRTGRRGGGPRDRLLIARPAGPKQ
jgi:A/G-specific adenine glycosylase